VSPAFKDARFQPRFSSAFGLPVWQAQFTTLPVWSVAVTQPWAANVVFRALPPDEFAAFQEPGYVKIVWTLRSDPIGITESIFRTETRALTTDSSARAKFRLYWSCFSPGIRLVRRMMLRSLKREAESQARKASVIMPDVENQVAG
jgi:hypothetical protein